MSYNFISPAEVDMSICTPIDKKLEWLYASFNCASKSPLKVTVMDTPSIVPGSIRVSVPSLVGNIE